MFPLPLIRKRPLGYSRYFPSSDVTRTYDCVFDTSTRILTINNVEEITGKPQSFENAPYLDDASATELLNSTISVSPSVKMVTTSHKTLKTLIGEDGRYNYECFYNVSSCFMRFCSDGTFIYLETIVRSGKRSITKFRIYDWDTTKTVDFYRKKDKSMIIDCTPKEFSEVMEEVAFHPNCDIEIVSSKVATRYADTLSYESYFDLDKTFIGIPRPDKILGPSKQIPYKCICLNLGLNCVCFVLDNHNGIVIVPRNLIDDDFAEEDDSISIATTLLKLGRSINEQLAEAKRTVIRYVPREEITSVVKPETCSSVKDGSLRYIMYGGGFRVCELNNEGQIVGLRNDASVTLQSIPSTSPPFAPLVEVLMQTENGQICAFFERILASISSA